MEPAGVLEDWFHVGWEDTSKHGVPHCTPQQRVALEMLRFAWNIRCLDASFGGNNSEFVSKERRMEHMEHRKWKMSFWRPFNTTLNG